MNDALYGSPLLSGCADVRGLFSTSHLSDNPPRYLTWLVDTSTPVVLAGLAVVLVPIRRLWGPSKARASVWILGSCVTASLWLTYSARLVFDNATYLRFLLPS